MRVPVQGRLEPPRLPDHVLRDVIPAAVAADLRPVPVHADAPVARGGTRRTGVGREPARQEARHADGHHRRGHLRRVLVSHSAVAGAQVGRPVRAQHVAVGHHPDHVARPGLHELVRQPRAVRLPLRQLPQSFPQGLVIIFTHFFFSQL